MSQMEVKVVGLIKLENKLRHLPSGIRPFFEKVGTFGQARMAKYAKPHPVDKGTLAEGVEFDIRGEARPLQMETHIGFVGRGFGSRSSMANLAETINRGRRPGKPPSFKAIRRWLKSHHYAANPRAIQRVIAQRGTRGVGFLEKAEKDVRKEIPKLIDEVARAIEREWDSR